MTCVQQAGGLANGAEVGDLDRVAEAEALGCRVREGVEGSMVGPGRWGHSRVSEEEEPGGSRESALGGRRGPAGLRSQEQGGQRPRRRVRPPQVRGAQAGNPVTGFGHVT